jgi:hypothetical protein
MPINISFHTDGTAQCLWTEAFSLHELGRLEVNPSQQPRIQQPDATLGSEGLEKKNPVHRQVQIRLPRMGANEPATRLTTHINQSTRKAPSEFQETTSKAKASVQPLHRPMYLLQQKFRRMMRLRTPHADQIKHPKAH